MDELGTPGNSKSGIVNRAKAILMSPKAEWPVIAGETESVQGVFTRYVLPLAAIGPICAFIGGQLFGIGAFGFYVHPSIVSGLSSAIIDYVLRGLVMTFVVAWVASFVADKFGGRQDYTRAFRLCAYSFTAAWIAGVLYLLPTLGILVLLASLYGIYLFYLGATPMMGVPQDKAIGYTAVTILGVIVIYIIIGAIMGALAGMFVTTSTTVGLNDAGGKYEMNVPGYGQLKMEDHGDKQTMEIPGVGKVEVTKDGNTVKIDSSAVKAEVTQQPEGTVTSTTTTTTTD